ncbi:MAG: hypothetical protein ACRCZ0_11490 [Cetobacterium sp.]
MSKFFNDCNIVIRNYVEFNRFGVGVKLPFKFHIQDIKQDFFDNDNKEYVLEDYPSEFCDQQGERDNYDYNNYLISFVDLKSFTMNFDEEDIKEYGKFVEECNEGYIFKSHEYLYSFLISYLLFSETDFKEIENFVIQSQQRIMRYFEKFLVEKLEIGSKKIEASEEFMLLRCAFELSRPPIFYENKGLGIADISWREYITQRIYLGRKCEIDKLQMDEAMKGGKKS